VAAVVAVTALAVATGQANAHTIPITSTCVLVGETPQIRTTFQYVNFDRGETASAAETVTIDGVLKYSESRPFVRAGTFVEDVPTTPGPHTISAASVVRQNGRDWRGSFGPALVQCPYPPVVPGPEPTPGTPNTPTSPPPPVVTIPPPVTVTPPPARTSRIVVTKRPNAKYSVKQGGVQRWTITVSNPGQTVLRNVLLTDLIPGRMSVVSAAPGMTFEAGTATWRIARLSPGHSVSRWIVLRADRDLRARQVCNVAIGRADTPRGGGQVGGGARSCVTVVKLPPVRRTPGVTG
jgi:uncharacterized repeat protein (TIGR01451 family)